jgi:hypothetical protein
MQGDGVSCGPIACLKILEFYGFIEVASIEKLGESILGYRHVVMDYYNDCVSRYDNILKVEWCIKKFPQEKQSKAGKDDVDCNVTTNDSAPELSVSVASAAELSSVISKSQNCNDKEK